MAVKFPLEMKDGVKVRNINELKDNFDVEKIIGYFLDGKLKAWLEARYYEEELEAIEQLDNNDSNLANKLCDIFEIEHEEAEEINTEEIVKRNERIAKLKQLTTDERIINNVDSVAFDQEELGELYDNDVEKIYLCEGSFVIPKSKCNLEYVLIDPVEVKGLMLEMPEDKVLDLDVNSNEKIDSMMEKSFDIFAYDENTYNSLKNAVTIGEKSINFEKELKNLEELVPDYYLADFAHEYDIPLFHSYSSKASAKADVEREYGKFFDKVKDTFRLNCYYSSGINSEFENFISQNINLFTQTYKKIQICRAAKNMPAMIVDVSMYHNRIKNMIIETGENIDVSDFTVSNYLTCEYFDMETAVFVKKRDISAYPRVNGMDDDLIRMKHAFTGRVKQNMIVLIKEAFGEALKGL